jgi:hypothetical protein
MHAPVSTSEKVSPAVAPALSAATIRGNLVDTPRAAVSDETVTRLADEGFSSEVVALAEDLAEDTRP